MDGYYLIAALAVGLGLLGFVEPCSVGANVIFLGHLREKERNARLRETAKFALSRSMLPRLFGSGITVLGPSFSRRRSCSGYFSVSCTLRWAWPSLPTRGSAGGCSA